MGNAVGRGDVAEKCSWWIFCKTSAVFGAWKNKAGQSGRPAASNQSVIIPKRGIGIEAEYEVEAERQLGKIPDLGNANTTVRLKTDLNENKYC